MIDVRFIIIGRASCPFCCMAADLCKASGTKYVFLDYENNQELLEEYRTFHDHPTVPIVLSNNLETGYTFKVGGYTEMLALIPED